MRRPAFTVAVPLALLTIATLAGCLAGNETVRDPQCQVVPHELFTLPLPGQDAAPGDPGQAWDALVRATPDDGVDLLVPPWADDDPNAEAVDVTLKALGAEGSLTRVRASPPGEADPVRVDVRWSDGDPCGRQGDATWHLTPEAGEVASAGDGVHVYTAGFWENGTLFYTNIEGVHDAAWPRAGWYEWSGGEPLPVYVYDQDPDERPPWWSVGVPAEAPVVGEVPVVGGTAAWSYFVTIPGFNEALKGLSTTTSRVVRLAPEEAYTRPEREDHPLYGDALVFHLYLTDVTPVPCWTQTPAGGAACVDAPGPPGPPVSPVSPASVPVPAPVAASVPAPVSR